MGDIKKEREIILELWNKIKRMLKAMGSTFNPASVDESTYPQDKS